MAEELPESIRAKMIKKIMKNLAKKEESKSIKLEDYVLSRLSDERARELLEKTKSLYPQAYPYVIALFYKLLEKRVVEELDGYTVYTVLQRLGIPVKPDLRIRFVKHGKEVDFKEYVSG